MPRFTREEEDRIASLMLEKLGDRVMYHTDWNVLCQPMSYSSFQGMLKYLLKKRYVRRVSRGVYKVTPKGKRQLSVWKENIDENKEGGEKK